MTTTLSPRFRNLLILLSGLLPLLFLADISTGSTSLSLGSILDAFMGKATPESFNIIYEIRLPRAITAIAAGAGLSLSGLLMQSLFRNPIAGPDILGVSPGAGLGVSLFVFMGHQLGFSYLGISQNLAATIGAFLVLVPVIMATSRSSNTIRLVIIGLTMSAIASSIISILQQFANQADLQRYTIWNNGSLGGVTTDAAFILIGVVVLSYVGIFFLTTRMDGMLAGSEYARSMGINIRQTRTLMILVTALLTGWITAQCGPLSFIGIAVPHIGRFLLRSQQHRYLLPISFLLGTNILLLCDMLCYLPGQGSILPVNAITSLLCAPVIIRSMMSLKG